MRSKKRFFWLVVVLALFFPARFALSLLHNTRAVEEAKRQLLAQIERGGAFEAVLGPMPPKAHIMSLGGGDLLGVVFGMTVDEQFRLLVSKLPKDKREALILRARQNENGAYVYYEVALQNCAERCEYDPSLVTRSGSEEYRATGGHSELMVRKVVPVEINNLPFFYQYTYGVNGFGELISLNAVVLVPPRNSLDVEVRKFLNSVAPYYGIEWVYRKDVVMNYCIIGCEND